MRRYFIVFSLLHAWMVYICRTTIIVQFRFVSRYYLNEIEKGYRGIDPLSTFTWRSRRMICYAVAHGKQFIGEHGPGNKIAVRKKIESLSLESINFLNYWDQEVTSGDENLNQLVLKYLPHCVSLCKRRVIIKLLTCGKTISGSWYVGFGLVPKVMYLLASSIDASNILAAGIIEPRALFVSSETISQVSEYFWNQRHILDNDYEEENLSNNIRTLHKLDTTSRTRICSSVFDVLNSAGALISEIGHINYIRIFHTGHRRKLKIYGKTISLTFLSCAIDNASPQFYLLEDRQEVDAVFVFFPELSLGLTNSVWLFKRIRKVRGLLHL